MFSKSQILGGLIGLGFLLRTSSGVVTVEFPAHSSQQISQFHFLEQPLELKVVVTLGGLTLIELELWWFLFNRNKTQKAEFSQKREKLKS